MQGQCSCLNVAQAAQMRGTPSALLLSRGILDMACKHSAFDIAIPEALSAEPSNVRRCWPLRMC